MPSPDGVELGNEIKYIKPKDKMATRRMDDKKKSKKHTKKQETDTPKRSHMHTFLTGLVVN